ncbi:TrkH family potassium uptake protein [Bacteroides sp. 51]|uniref:TrkH family potassium uptake protein n=1 Tax=Bacteroides sp. 51 TaxID=2302938 RepID=UPI0013D6FC14|nr:potassium transporter TrkG [Bacteroides sp. 51]NDV83837.1 potassium transporter [Bacteroides sp. 51]
MRGIENWPRHLAARILMGVMTVITDLAALIFLTTIVYEFGFGVSTVERDQLINVYIWVWIIFLLDITLHLIFRSGLKQDRYKRLARMFSILFYLTLIPIVFPALTEVEFLSWLWNFLDSRYYRLTLLFVFSFFYLSNSVVRLLGRRTNPSLILGASFLFFILIGTGLLMLPRSTFHGISWVDSLFVATSSVCVTGLSPFDMTATFTPFGFTIIIILIQIGALGVMTFTSFFALFFMGNTSLYNQLIVRDMVSSKSLNSLFSTLMYTLAFTLIIEGIGTLLIWWNIHGTLNMNLKDELLFSLFHSISAFCNAGVSTLSGNVGNPLLMNGHNPFFLSISILIILGGIGYPILVNLKDIIISYLKRLWIYLHTREPIHRKIYHQFSLNTRIVFITTFFLLILGTLAIVYFEWDHALAGMSVADKWTQAFFNSVASRTAGFNSIHLTTLTTQSLLFYMLFMWIGGGAQSTAGGIKVNAFAVIVLNMFAILRGADRVEVFGRELSPDSIRRANAAMIISLGAIFTFVFLLTILEPEIPLVTLVFECIAAFSTAGTSLGATPLLNNESKILIAVLMFIGRVGLVTLILGMVKQKKHTKYRYPSDDIIIN